MVTVIEDSTFCFSLFILLSCEASSIGLLQRRESRITALVRYGNSYVPPVIAETGNEAARAAGDQH